MPCCALAAAIIGQFILAFHAMKRALFGADGTEERNAAVEWRLDLPSASLIAADRGPLWTRRPRLVGGLAIAAVVEILLVLGGLYGVIEHFSHGTDHASHVHAAHVHAAADAAPGASVVQEVEP